MLRPLFTRRLLINKFKGNKMSNSVENNTLITPKCEKSVINKCPNIVVNSKSCVITREIRCVLCEQRVVKKNFLITIRK
jgi:hypothetical protein